MPLLDRTGPEGKGSRTGRILGDCPPGTKAEERKKIIARRAFLARRRRRRFGA